MGRVPPPGIPWAEAETVSQRKKIVIARTTVTRVSAAFTSQKDVAVKFTPVSNASVGGEVRSRMEPGCYSAAIAAVRHDFAIEFATTPQQQEEAFRLRHQVYCLERNFEPGEDGLECDEYD